MKTNKKLRHYVAKDLLKFLLTLFIAFSLVYCILSLYLSPQVKSGVRECKLEGTPAISICILVTSVMIGAWFYWKGKSVKALNDLLLFLSAAIASYYYFFDFNKYETIKEHSFLCSNIGYLCWQLLLVNCSFAKAWISLIEFFQERALLFKSNDSVNIQTDKELFFYNIAISIIKKISRKNN